MTPKTATPTSASTSSRGLPLTLVNQPRHGSRSRMTCEFRCGNACDAPIPNTSENPEIGTIITKAIARRALLQAGAAGAGVLTLNTMLASPAAATPHAAAAARAAVQGPSKLGTVAFAPVAPNINDTVTVPDGFRADTVIRWGDKVLKDAPAFDPATQSPEAAKAQFGYNNDYVGILPLRGDNYLLVANHEYTDEQLMFPAGAYTPEEIKAIAMANHGMSVVKIERRKKRKASYKVSDLRNGYNRRLHIDTAFELVGPAAGDARLKTSADTTGRKVLGTLNNCAGGLTPWGTVLSGEENFNQYFDKSGSVPPEYVESYNRYGITGSRTRGWSSVDSRFDLSVEPNEPFRFGWIVEVDPYDKNSTPVKHTMLGRFKHEGANMAVTKDGRAVAYMGDDERGDYLYKFVSKGKIDFSRGAKARKKNMSLLTRGTLFVAELTGDGDSDGVYDGGGQWIALCSDTVSYVPGMSVADVLINTRLAADKLAPTKMDRPEDVEANPVNGRIYVALTNNSNRGTAYPTDEANPLASSMVRSSLDAPLTEASGNRNGYILEMQPYRRDHASSTFTWNLLLVCGDPEAPETYFAGFDKSLVSPISCPDNVAFDPEGNLWISTDGNQLGSNDGFFRVPLAGDQRGRVEQFLTVPFGAETCGPFITTDGRSAFIAVQHPGETDGSTFEAPSSTWPHTDAFPRPSVVVAYQR